MASRTGKAKTRVDPVVKLARTILPESQVVRRDLAIRDVANHSAADQRASIRSGETQTVRRLTRVEKLRNAHVITPEQAAACEWYGEKYELAFEYGQGICANYGGVGGGGGLGWDHGSRSIAQSEARKDIIYARHGIPAHLLDLFERVVVGHWDAVPVMTKEDKARFSLAAFRLHEQVGHLLSIAA